MNELDPERLEAELQTLRPAKPPQELLDRVFAQLSEQSTHVPWTEPRRRPGWANWNLLRWLVPTAAAAAVFTLLFFALRTQSQKQPPVRRLISSARPLLKADKVEIDRQWVADFDAIAQLPSGEPVRFRCQEWRDKVWLRDSATGLVIERTTPRLEIVPVRFETY